MKSRWTRIVVSCLMILTIVAALSLSCGKKEKEGRTIVIGHISDMSGPAATALIPINYALKDLATYYNDNNLIPGVTFKVVEWDSRYDNSRIIPGWDWIRGRDAVLGFTAFPSVGEVLKPFAETEKMPVWALAYGEALDYPPGWVFLANCPNRNLINPLLKWISENDPDFPTDRPAKIGSAGWIETYAVACKAAVKEYALAHPDKWEWVGGYLEPAGAMSWTADVAGLKDCDYLWPPSTGTGTSTFMKQFRDKGYTAKFIGTDAHAAYRSLIIDTVGWAGVDGMLATSPTRWWTETQSPIVSLARQLLQTYHPDKFDEFVYAGVGYIGGFQQTYAFFDVLKKAVEDVGAENFNGQAFYDTAIHFSNQWPTYEQWKFTETRRYTWDYVGIYKWSAAAQDIVRIVDPWLPNNVT